MNETQKTQKRETPGDVAVVSLPMNEYEAMQAEMERLRRAPAAAAEALPSIIGKIRSAHAILAKVEVAERDRIHAAAGLRDLRHALSVAEEAWDKDVMAGVVQPSESN